MAGRSRQRLLRASGLGLLRTNGQRLLRTSDCCTQVGHVAARRKHRLRCRRAGHLMLPPATLFTVQGPAEVSSGEPR